LHSGKPALTTVPIEIIEEDVSSLDRYASVSSAFDISKIVDVDSLTIGSSNLELKTTQVPASHKDYDSLPANSPRDWPKQFDVRTWRLFISHIDGEHVG